MDFIYWKNHFIGNQRHMSNIPVDTPSKELSRQLLPFLGSIKQMQKGEQSEGHNLLRMAKHYSEQSGHHDYQEIIKMFIREEQRHAAILRDFLQVHGVLRLTKHWVDGSFRALRRFFNLRFAISTLLIAETIALVYYSALEKSTSSKMLKSICLQVLRDEHQHVLFQIETLKMFQSEQGPIKNLILSVYSKILMTGTLMVVWPYHKAVLRQEIPNLMAFIKKVKATLKKYQSLTSSNRQEHYSGITHETA